MYNTQLKMARSHAIKYARSNLRAMYGKKKLDFSLTLSATPGLMYPMPQFVR